MRNKHIIVLLSVLAALVLLCTGAPAEEEYRTLKIGSEGKDVLQMKQAMYWLGYFTTINLSDSYNSTTEERIRWLQRNNGLEETGIATPELQQLIFSGKCIPSDSAPAPSPVPTPIPTPVHPITTPNPPPLNEQHFLSEDSPEEEYIYTNEDDGIWVYISKDISITVKRYYDKPAKHMWYEAEIFCSENAPLKTYVNLNQKGNFKDAVHPLEYARDNRIVLAVTDDHFRNRRWSEIPIGTVIRNGRIFSSKTVEQGFRRFPNLEVLALFKDGSMKTYRSNAHTSQEYLDMGATQVFAFGPILVQDGKVNPELYGNLFRDEEPRMALGMIEPNHYLVIAVNGRVNKKYNGAYLDWLAEKMLAAGAVEALNLDGGGTACLAFMGKRLNDTGSPTRKIYSLIGFGNSDSVPR